jgi:hypothetical protein
MTEAQAMKIHYLGEDGQPLCNVPMALVDQLGINPGEITWL